ncbi:MULTISPECIES: DUF2147 domain-containing protein [unclassified Chryseobacterium]|uniref:DUF2147 domain-containing protein n=1 Tax=unclassified Chryseobacterium TaxID=2593645 RepID=UPI00117522DE|nr:DUF2147 domain-containing protein [Chryseobacterium sp. ON_d1]GEJ46075.1 hypothetical protein CRS_26830 [Chryseobacterium sp. ON_d1]
MKTLKILFVLMLTFAGRTFAQDKADAILGKWESDKKDVKMEIFRQGDKYYGRYLWGNQIVEKDGVTSKKDTKNPDVKLRSRDLIGMTSLTGLTWDGEEYVDGKIYNAPSGDTYKCKAWIKDGKMNLRGFMGVSLLGKTATFHRIK